MHLLLVAACLCLSASLSSAACASTEPASSQEELDRALEQAKRIPTSDGWFEVIKLPGNVYAFHEPGHAEDVNSFLILGKSRDLLYDTGMGIASIKQAIAEVRQAEDLPERELVVFNSHGHLDHIGGNQEFDAILAYENDWRTRKLVEGIPAGQDIWVEYYQSLTPPPHPPRNFSPQTMSVPPVDKASIQYLQKGDMIDLGNRQFNLMISSSHTDDSVMLYDRENQLLFTGDVFVPDGFYVLDFDELYKDLKSLKALEVTYHYNTHGPQLLRLGIRAEALEAAEKIKSGSVEAESEYLLGDIRQVYRADGFTFWHMAEFLMY